MALRDWIRRRVAAAFLRAEALARDVEARELRRRFAACGRGTHIEPPVHVFNPQCIWLGERISIRSYVRLEAVTAWKNGGSFGFTPRLEIGDGTLIQYLAHIGCNHRVVIGRNVGISAKVYITDHVHLFEDVERSPLEQEISPGSEVVFEDDVFLGEAVVVLPGVRIGR
ncbi:MAG: acyltransferase, partial [Candidatus Binatia bacterium]